MTLILTCAAPDFVVQASDRRLTNPLRPGWVIDEENKAVFLAGHAFMAFTGLAYVRREPTARWALRHIHPIDLQTSLDQLTVAATNDFRAIDFDRRIPRELRPSLKRTAFVATGFGIAEGSPEMRSFVWLCSNFHDDDGGMRDTADRAFTPRFLAFGVEEAFIHAAGQPVPSELLNRLERQLREAVGRGVGPQSVGRLLSRAIRSVAATNDYVGRSIMCCILSRDAVGLIAPGQFGMSTGLIPVGLEDPPESAFFGTSHGSGHPLPIFIYWPSSPGGQLVQFPHITNLGINITEAQLTTPPITLVKRGRDLP